MRPKVEIVVECGCEHLGNMKIAEAMINAAKWAGADTVKFQLYETKLINDPKLHLFLEKARLDISNLWLLRDYCKEVQIEFLCSAFDIPSLKSLSNLCNRIKIPSGQLHSKSYLKCAKSLKLPLILSTGMSTLNDIADATNILDCSNIILLHCNSAYPTPDENANLEVIKLLKDVFAQTQCPYLIGFSDHTLGNTAAIMAVALGAVMIEKHFTLFKFFKTPDTETSLTPEQFKSYVEDIRRAEVMLGTGEKVPTESEKPNMFRRDFR